MATSIFGYDRLGLATSPETTVPTFGYGCEYTCYFTGTTQSIFLDTSGVSSDVNIYGAVYFVNWALEQYELLGQTGAIVKNNTRAYASSTLNVNVETGKQYALGIASSIIVPNPNAEYNIYYDVIVPTPTFRITMTLPGVFPSTIPFAGLSRFGVIMDHYVTVLNSGIAKQVKVLRPAPFKPGNAR
jgi:hypothetical protein